MKEWYQNSGKEVLEALGVTPGGLSDSQVKERKQKYGGNALQETKRKGSLQVFLEQFQDLLVIILIVAAVISMLTDNVESTVVIFAVIILNAILGTVQHQKAEKSLESLKSLSSPCTRVMRNGRKMELSSVDVVPGDILILETGDLVVADGRVLESYALQVNESSLTGESINVEKQTAPIKRQAPLGDRINMVYSGSLVTAGRGMVVVTETGMNTEIGKIAQLMNATKEKKTPLQVSLDRFSSKLAAGIMIICAVVFFLSLYRKMPVLDSLMFAVALAVAAIPEALSSIVTIVQAMGTQKMAKEHAIIKELKAVESLGCVSVICSDKTGTLTQNRMEVQKVYLGGRVWEPDKLRVEQKPFAWFLYGAVLANDSSWQDGRGIGDPTELALLEMAHAVGMKEGRLREQFPRISELAFDSDRKMMSTEHRVDGKAVMFSKGAIDTLLDRTDWILDGEKRRPIGVSDKRRIQNQNLEFSRDGLRVLMVVCKELEKQVPLKPELENGFTFLGLVAMMDPARPESRPAVASARRAGIRTVMITGDHKVTASAIAEKIGIMEPGDVAVTGQELDGMSDEMLGGKLESISVYARVSPENKIRIVDAWQQKGKIVAMTGDGVNDAPALKKADIGIAMGITGTEVSKDAASMILADDNFATIIKAVANGRNVYRNIKNAIKFLLSGNMAGILCVLYTSLLALPIPFAPVHLLFINLLTDSLPAIAIGMEQPEAGLLEQGPRDPQEGILTKSFLSSLVLQGGLIAACTMMAYRTGLWTGGAAVASTMAFTTLTLARLFHGFNCRSEHSIIALGVGSNLYTVMAFEAGVLLLLAVLFVPRLQILFAVSDLSLRQLLSIVIFALIPTAIIQAWKTIREGLA
ncbi:cation-translocating P-type ATPase [Hungatella hathewayi]|uniref:Cation-transporting P-type ATPase N-terminal domain-containing protein n=1 Tax=Hungatella hathewayi WAL-18680 TaxID=742737 RepID=G5ILR6_9FIRM|nr:cation-translocating P-type ATPase [Hungatella hathewayi]EHI57335.1 hypothetical protein HMPREF9473_04444 [ [Hungatella hathewayi WAL-18680]MBS4984960.1 cation-translocating P-type ATPase [Hungatella hathewayi]